MVLVSGLREFRVPIQTSPHNPTLFGTSTFDMLGFHAEGSGRSPLTLPCSIAQSAAVTVANAKRGKFGLRFPGMSSSASALQLQQHPFAGLAGFAIDLFAAPATPVRGTSINSKPT
jgi:hypothetical protein